MEIEPEDLVLVAVVKSARDLEIARVLGWYRIPLATAPKTLRVDWLAFYQSAAFGEEKWSVRYVSPVRGFELARRGELLQDEPDHARAEEPYFKVMLGPMQSLPRPILARRWRRVTFLFTTGERLAAAHDLTDLRVPASRKQDRLWGLLRERGA